MKSVLSDTLPENQKRPLAVVLIVAWNGMLYLSECLTSLRNASSKIVDIQILVINNASTDETSKFVKQQFPDVTIVDAIHNLGFCGGNNLGWELIKKYWPNATYVALLNQDTIVESDWLVSLCCYLDAHPETAIVQPKLLLHPEKHLLNSAGNQSHFLGFGFTQKYRSPDDGRADEVKQIGFASGAALVVRTSILRELGLFENGMKAYLEDADLGWKARQAGHRVEYVPLSRVYHKYQPKTDWRNYESLERNRWWLLLVYYRWRTLLLLLPALIAMEFGQVLFALGHRRLKEKLRAIGWFLNRQNQQTLWQLRQRAAAHRKCSDRDFLKCFSGTIDSGVVDSWLLRRVANPAFAAYWAIAKRLIWW